MVDSSMGPGSWEPNLEGIEARLRGIREARDQQREREKERLLSGLRIKTPDGQEGK